MLFSGMAQKTPDFGQAKRMGRQGADPQKKSPEWRCIKSNRKDNPPHP